MQVPTQSSPYYKVVFMGDSGVGKTSIIQRINTQKFDVNLDSTIGAAAISKDVLTAQGTVSLNIWDTAGQERYRSLISTYARNANAAVLCFDLSSYASFQSLESWVQELNKFSNETCVVFIVGNKSDIEQKVPLSNVSEWCQSRKYKFLVTSAKTGEGIDEMLKQIAEDVTSSGLITYENKIDIDPKKDENKGSSCC